VVDEFTLGFVAGVCALGLVAVVVFTLLRWFRGDSKDTLHVDRASNTDPDLRPAVIEYALDEAAAQIVSYGLTQAEYRAARARLTLAVRARRGEALSDMELGVLLGVIPPPSSRKDILPVSLRSDAA
jgi:hypothetical protein